MRQVRSTVFLTFSNFFALHLTSSRSSVETSEGFIEQVSLARYTMIKVLVTVEGKYTWNINISWDVLRGGSPCTTWRSVAYRRSSWKNANASTWLSPKCCMHLWTALTLLVAMMMVEIAMVNTRWTFKSSKMKWSHICWRVFWAWSLVAV